jgi:hypothetical protein
LLLNSFLAAIQISGRSLTQPIGVGRYGFGALFIIIILRVSSPLRGASNSAVTAPMAAPRIRNKAFSPALFPSLIEISS